MCKCTIFLKKDDNFQNNQADADEDNFKSSVARHEWTGQSFFWGWVGGNGKKIQAGDKYMNQTLLILYTVSCMVLEGNSVHSETGQEKELLEAEVKFIFLRSQYRQSIWTVIRGW